MIRSVWRFVCLSLRRCHKTYANYLGHVRIGCLLLGKSDQVFVEGRTALNRAKACVSAAGLHIALLCIGIASR